MRPLSHLILIISLAGFAATTCYAAVITAIGENATNADQWRTQTTKAINSAGNNIYGNDGYVMFSTSAVGAGTGYISGNTSINPFTFSGTISGVSGTVTTLNVMPTSVSAFTPETANSSQVLDGVSTSDLSFDNPNVPGGQFASGVGFAGEGSIFETTNQALFTFTVNSNVPASFTVGLFFLNSDSVATSAGIEGGGVTTPVTITRSFTLKSVRLLRQIVSPFCCKKRTIYRLLLVALIRIASISVAEGRGSPAPRAKFAKAEWVGLLGKTKAQMDRQFGKPIGEDNDEFVYDITQKGFDKPRTWTAIVQFDPLSKRVEVAEYSHRRFFLMDVVSLLSNEDKNSIIKANIPNADLANVQNTIPNHFAFDPRSNKNVKVKAFIVQDKKSHKSYYVETGYYRAKGIDFEQHVSFVHISDLSLTAGKALNSSKR